MDAEAYVEMLPWLVFVVIDRKHGLGVAWAGGGALSCSAGLVGWSYWRGRYTLLPWVGLAVFAICLVTGLAFSAWNHEVGLSRALAVVTLSVLAFGSLRFTPLSEAYTAHLVAPGMRDDLRFRKVNLDMTSAWGVGSLAVAVACAATALLSGLVFFTLLDWVTPLVLATVTILWGARRWELFRLAVDSFPVEHRTTKAVVVVHHRATRDAVGFSGPSNRAADAVSPLGLAEPGSQGAVIRQLPLRRRDG